MGGGGFTMDERTPALDALVLALTGKTVPKICFLPTASGDPSDQVSRFHERFERMAVRAQHPVVVSSRSRPRQPS